VLVHAGRWAAVLDYVDGLPSASRYNEAIMNDPETAEYLAQLSLEQGEEGRDSYAPRLSEWDIHATLQREMVDAIKSLIAVTLRVAGGKPGDVKPFPTPRTAVEAAKKEAERRWAVDFGAQLGFSPEDF
jgi:hypothetical protein